MHTRPEVLALLALGDHAAEFADREHLAGCDRCLTELVTLTRLIEQGRTSPDGATLDAPSETVWAAIQAELGFIPVTRSWPTAPEPAASGAAVDSAGGPSVGPAPMSRTTPATGHVGRPDQSGSAKRGTPAGSPTMRRHRRLWLILAAVLALAVGISIGIGVERLLQPAETVIGHATLEAMPSWPGATGTATMQVDRSGDRTLIVDLHTPQSVDQGRQVWLIATGATGMRSLGFLDAEGRGRLPVPPGLDLARFTIVDVSAEPVSDTDVTDSGNSIASGELRR